jgi:N-acetylneuraminic acid mutarotase
MRSRRLCSGVLILGVLGLAACGDDATTEPTPVAQPAANTPELALASDSWLTRANMLPNRTDLAVATVTNAAGQSVVYAIGGLTPTGIPLDKVLAYNVATNTWSFRRPLPVPRAGTNGAGVINGKIYVSGGYADYGGDFPTRSLYMYDPATNRWTQKSDIPRAGDWGEDYPGGNGVTGVINNKLYVVSGCFRAWEPWGYYEDCNPLFYRYNPATDRWVTLPRPFEGLSTYAPSAGGVIDGKFYVMAKVWNELEARFEVYDPATNRWSTRTPLGLARPEAASAVLDGKLFMMGGLRLNASREAWDTLAITIVYDPATDAWTRRAALPTPRAGIAATRVFLDGQARIEVLGGVSPGNNIQYVP